MRNVTTEYHTANKADTRSSDFLIVSDSGFGLTKISGSSAWVSKTPPGDNPQRFSMWQCGKETSDSVTNYGYIEIGGRTQETFYFSASQKNSITICFEDECYPTELYIEFYKADGISPVLKTTKSDLTNDRKILTYSYEDLYEYAGENESSLHLLRFYFTKWSKQGVKPVILFSTYGEPAIFTKDDLMSVDITLETDITAQSIPYNSYACTIIDEVDAYNPLLINSKIHDFTSGQKFYFFNFEKSVESLTDDLSLYSHEFCPVGVAYFRQAKQQGTAVDFDFIDIVEKYDKTPLSEAELELSSHFIKRNVKDYTRCSFTLIQERTNLASGTEKTVQPIQYPLSLQP